jgi:hypothetical protein
MRADVFDAPASAEAGAGQLDQSFVTYCYGQIRDWNNESKTLRKI